MNIGLSCHGVGLQSTMVALQGALSERWAFQARTASAMVAGVSSGKARRRHRYSPTNISAISGPPNRLAKVDQAATGANRNSPVDTRAMPAKNMHQASVTWRV